MVSSNDHICLYGFLRKELISRYFTLGRERRNDFYQESTGLPLTREEILALPPDEQAQALWRKQASRDNPWLFGCKLTVALATEARLGLPGAEPLLGRLIRSCERLFPFSGSFRGLPLRWDPVTSDDWADPPPGQAERLPTQFLITPAGRDYVFSMPPNDPRHFPRLVPFTGRRLMDRRLYERYAMAREREDGGYVGRYRFWECSQDELVGAVTTYVAAAEGTRDAGLRTIARRRLMRVAEYLAAHGYLMVMPAGGLAARGPGDALPALEWPFRHAIARATGRDLSGLATVSFQQGLEAAGIWELFQGPTDRAMAASWVVGLTAGSPFLVALEAVLAGWGAATFSPRFLTPGDIGFVAGIASAADGFDVSRDDAAGGMALAALLHAWAPESRFRNYADLVGRHTGAGAPYSTGFVPYLGFLAGEDDPTTNVVYARWYATRQDRRVDTDDYSATCFAAAVAVLLGPMRNVVLERALVDRLKSRHDDLAASGAVAIVSSSDITHAVDYLAALALAWRYRQEHNAVGDPIDTAGFPEVPPADVVWPSRPSPERWSRRCRTGSRSGRFRAAIRRATTPAEGRGSSCREALRDRPSHDRTWHFRRGSR